MNLVNKKYWFQSIKENVNIVNKCNVTVLTENYYYNICSNDITTHFTKISNQNLIFHHNKLLQGTVTMYKSQNNAETETCKTLEASRLEHSLNSLFTNK